MITNKTVLVLSENQEQFALTASLIRDEGFSVLFAGDAILGLKMAKADPPRMIIAELAMRGMDGLELCRRIRKDKQTRPIPILLIGDLSRDSTIVEDALLCGANDYLQRSFDQIQLFGQCSKIIGIESREAHYHQLDSTFRVLIENITDIITVLSANGTILFESPSIERVLGYKPDELAGMQAFDFIHPDDVRGVLKFFQLAIDNFDTSLPIEYRFRHKDGSWKLIESTGRPFDDPKHGVATVITSRDITERVDAGTLLRKSQEHLSLAQQAARIGSFEYDFRTGQAYSSPELESLYGIVPGGLNKSYSEWNKFVHPDDLSKAADELKVAVESGEHDSEIRIIRTDGSIRWLHSKGKVYYRPDGTPERLVGVNMDITGRRETEDALQHQKQLYKSLVDSIEGIVWESSAKTFEFSFVSEQAERLLGYPAQQWIDNPTFWADHLHPDDREAVIDYCVNAAARLENHEFDYRIIAADGRVVWLHDIVTVDTSDEDNVRLRGVMVDITKSKQDEADLAEANERAKGEYAQLLERLATLGQRMGAAKDLESVFKAIIEFANTSMPCSGLIISLYDKEKSLRNPIYMSYNGVVSDASELMPIPVSKGPVGKAIEHGDVLIFNDYLNALGIDSTIIHIGYDEDDRDPRSAIVAPLKVLSETIGILELQSYILGAYTPEHASAMRMAANLTANAIENVRLIELEKIRAEQLQQSQQLESVGRLAGGIAHDFNNMLTAINGYSDLTLRKLKNEDPLNIRNNIEEIKKAGERSAVLTQQLLAFSRRQVLKPRVIDLNQTVTETATLLEMLIGENIELVLNLAPDLGTTEADAGQLTQVIMNLAVNSRDAMPDGGKLIIETSNQLLDGESAGKLSIVKKGSYVMLSVSDTGIGMSEEVQDHLFEPFFTTKALGKGTGLGLATVYGIVKQSGGYILMYSEPGNGTTAKVYIPSVDTPVTEIAMPSAAAVNLQGSERILLVEDEEIVRKLSRQILETCGYTVVEACNGVEALEICEQTDCHFDLLVTDVVMPKMSGRILVQKLAEIRPGLRALFMSGYTDDAVVRHGVIAADQGFIQKPFTFDALASKVREVLDIKT